MQNILETIINNPLMRSNKYRYQVQHRTWDYIFRVGIRSKAVLLAGKMITKEPLGWAEKSYLCQRTNQER